MNNTVMTLKTEVNERGVTIPIVPGCSFVSDEVPWIFIAYAAKVGKTHPPFAYLYEKAAGKYHVFSDHLSTIDPENTGVSVDSYYQTDKTAWKEYRCNGQKLIDGKWIKVDGFNYKYQGAAPNTDPSAISPWTPDAETKIESAKPTIPSSIGPEDLSDSLPQPTAVVGP